MYITRLSSPVGVLLLAADGIALTGLWMEGQKYFAATLSKDAVEQPDLPVFRQTAQWLSAYFDGAPLPAMPPLAPQAVGGAVGHNPISILIPCHRVVGADGSLTGYAGGVDKKRFLLELEGADMTGLSIPRRATAR